MPWWWQAARGTSAAARTGGPWRIAWHFRSAEFKSYVIGAGLARALNKFTFLWSILAAPEESGVELCSSLRCSCARCSTNVPRSRPTWAATQAWCGVRSDADLMMRQVLHAPRNPRQRRHRCHRKHKPPRTPPPPPKASRALRLSGSSSVLLLRSGLPSLSPAGRLNRGGPRVVKL